MQKVDTAELRRLHDAAMQETSTPQDLRRSMNAAYLALPALLDELEAAREELRRLTQANGDIRKERDRAVKEAQRQDGVAKGLRAENERLTDCIFQGEGIDATGELGITRQNFREWINARDRHTKLIGAAEWLEANNKRLDTMNRADVEQEAAKLRQEAEGK